MLSGEHVGGIGVGGHGLKSGGAGGGAGGGSYGGDAGKCIFLRPFI